MGLIEGGMKRIAQNTLLLYFRYAIHDGYITIYQ